MPSIPRTHEKYKVEPLHQGWACNALSTVIVSRFSGLLLLVESVAFNPTPSHHSIVPTLGTVGRGVLAVLDHDRSTESL